MQRLCQRRHMMARLQLFVLAVALLGTASGAPLQSILDAASELEPWIIETQTVSAAQRAAPACMINKLAFCVQKPDYFTDLLRRRCTRYRSSCLIHR